MILLGVMNGPLKFLTARKILPLLDLLAKFKRVLACSCSPSFCVARKLAKQFFYFCSCSQKNRSARHTRECSQRPFVTPSIIFQQGPDGGAGSPGNPGVPGTKVNLNLCIK